MHQLRRIPTRARYALAVCGVISLTTVVPPAFGASPVATQIAQALKLAKKADKNATTALRLAKAAGTGSTAAGAEGASGATGAQGPAGPKGDAGAKGADGARGADGAAGVQGPKGDAGAQGPAGPQGPAGVAGPQGPAGPAGSSTVYAFNATPAQPSGPYAFSEGTPAVPVNVPVPAGSYVVNAQLTFGTSVGGNSSNATCQLRDPANAVLDAGTVAVPIQGTGIPTPKLALSASITLNSAGSFTVTCLAADPGNIYASRVNFTAMSVSSIVRPTPTP